jgi:hypothetical protein
MGSAMPLRGTLSLFWDIAVESGPQPSDRDVNTVSEATSRVTDMSLPHTILAVVVLRHFDSRSRAKGSELNVAPSWPTESFIKHGLVYQAETVLAPVSRAESRQAAAQGRVHLNEAALQSREGAERNWFGC